jgi:hypothetical protein
MPGPRFADDVRQVTFYVSERLWGRLKEEALLECRSRPAQLNIILEDHFRQVDEQRENGK